MLRNGGNVFLIFLFGQNLKFYFYILKNSRISPKIVTIVEKNFNFFLNLHNFRKSNQFLESLDIYLYGTKFLILENDVN